MRAHFNGDGTWSVIACGMVAATRLTFGQADRIVRSGVIEG